MNLKVQGGKMEKISMVTLAVHPFWVRQTVLLAESLRAFGGSLAQAPLTILTPASGTPLSQEFKIKAAESNAELVAIEIEEAALKFPLGFLPFAAVEAEKLASGRTEQLAWVLPDTLFISPPESFVLPTGKQLAYRPVHHSNIGSEFEWKLNPYWSQVYRHCHVPDERVFPMTTCTRDKLLRPYINAGMLVTRPENGFMQAWMESFSSAYQHEDFLPLVENRRHAIFLHQAILSAVMMNRYTQTDLQELPEEVNYPLHLHNEYPPEHRPASLNRLITCRYESIKVLRKGLDKINVEPPLDTWLTARTVEKS
jgi:hypothetical protein